MRQDDFDRTIEEITSGQFSQAINRLLEIGSHIADAPDAMLTCRKTGDDYIVASRGLPFGGSRTLPALPQTERLFFDGPIIVEDIATHPLLAKHPLATRPPGWRWAVVVPVRLPGLPDLIALTIGDQNHRERPIDMTERLRRLAEIVADELQLMIELVAQATGHDTVADAALPFPHPALSSDGEDPAVVTRFLVETLIAQQRLLSRGPISYHGVRRWRAPLKPWQLAALKLLKEQPPRALLDVASLDLADTAVALFGADTIKAVTNVACGHSGSGCFAEQLAQAVAVRLNVPYERAFADLPVSGSSHPARNRRRPALSCIASFDVPVLLIDDVATSGAHIAEATTVLRQGAPAVFPLAWIAA